jgi:hypothetical protein
MRRRDAIPTAKGIGTLLLRRSVSVLRPIEAGVKTNIRGGVHSQDGLFSRRQFGQDTPPFCV